MDFFLKKFGELKKISLPLSNKIITMEGQELSGSTNQELKMVYSPILGVEYILVDVEETEEKE
jgi:hypothetical protein